MPQNYAIRPVPIVETRNILSMAEVLLHGGGQPVVSPGCSEQALPLGERLNSLPGIIEVDSLATVP